MSPNCTPNEEDRPARPKAHFGVASFKYDVGLGGGTAPDLLITKLNYFGTVVLVEGLRPALAKKSGAVVLLCSNSAPMIPEDEAFLDALLAGDEAKSLDLAENHVAQGTHYMLTKRALNYWMRRNCMAYGRDGIRMNAVAPGPTITPMTKPLFESEEYAPIMQSLLDQTPANRAAEAEEISSCIQFLLSPAASIVYGTLVFADGGYDAHVRTDHV